MVRFLLVVSALFACPLNAYSWSSDGHKAIAVIAERRLTPTARAEVGRLLSREGKVHLSDVATWADAVRKFKVPQQPSHGVRLPLDHTPFDPKLHCKKNMCAVGAIVTLTEALADPRASLDAKMMALKYVVHLVGDIHQPLHASRESADIFLNRKMATLHKVWDYDIIKSKKLNWITVASLIERLDTSVVVYGTPMEWATESRDISRDFIFPKLPDNMVLGADYMAENWPIVVRRMHEAGSRLAGLLNRCLDPANAIPDN